MPLFYFVPRTGLEPVTLCLEGRCSIQLSYRGIKVKLNGELLLRSYQEECFRHSKKNSEKHRIFLVERPTRNFLTLTNDMLYTPRRED